MYANLWVETLECQGSLKLTSNPVVSHRALIALCDDMRDGPCVEQACRKGVALAPRSSALQRGHISAIAPDDALRAKVITGAWAQGIAPDHLKALEAERRLPNSRKTMQADGGTEVAIHESIAKTVRHPWLDERIGHMFNRRSFYPRALEFYNGSALPAPLQRDSRFQPFTDQAAQRRRQGERQTATRVAVGAGIEYAGRLAVCEPPG